MDEIRQTALERLGGRGVTEAELDTVVQLLQSRGLVYRLNSGPGVAWVLLKPELVNQYGASIVQAAGNHPLGIGAVAERDVLVGELAFAGFQRLSQIEEALVLRATVELLIGRDLCFREMGYLVFPSQINVTRLPPGETHSRTEVACRVSGGIETIYASLVVRLSYTDYFRREDQWKYAVEFSRDGVRLGFSMRQVEEGTGELEIHFFPGISEFDHVTFIRFVTEHLRAKGIDIEEQIRLYCPKCSKEVVNREAIEVRIGAGLLDIPCQYCATPVLIPRSVEARGLHVIGAGTFGAPASEQVAGTPLQYNLLTFEPEKGEMIVQTRKKEKPDGTWSADARWGSKNAPRPSYIFQVPSYKKRT